MTNLRTPRNVSPARGRQRRGCFSRQRCCTPLPPPAPKGDAPRAPHVQALAPSLCTSPTPQDPAGPAIRASWQQDPRVSPGQQLLSSQLNHSVAFLPGATPGHRGKGKTRLAPQRAQPPRPHPGTCSAPTIKSSPCCLARPIAAQAARAVTAIAQ